MVFKHLKYEYHFNSSQIYSFFLHYFQTVIMSPTTYAQTHTQTQYLWVENKKTTTAKRNCRFEC